jgi:hypothetical protein
VPNRLAGRIAGLSGFELVLGFVRFRRPQLEDPGGDFPGRKTARRQAVDVRKLEEAIAK